MNAPCMQNHYSVTLNNNSYIKRNMDPAQAILLEEITKNSIINETILRGDSTIQQFYENAVIFVSGGSGFLGKNLIEKLLRYVMLIFQIVSLLF